MNQNTISIQSRTLLVYPSYYRLQKKMNTTTDKRHIKKRKLTSLLIPSPFPHLKKRRDLNPPKHDFEAVSNPVAVPPSRDLSNPCFTTTGKQRQIKPQRRPMGVMRGYCKIRCNLFQTCLSGCRGCEVVRGILYVCLVCLCVCQCQCMCVCS